MWKTTVFLLVSVGLRLSGEAATNYVDCTRSDDSGAGTSWANAKRTIQAAVNTASAGDTVLVAPGVYSEGLTVTPGGYLSNRVVITKNIVLASRDGAAATVIQGARDAAGNAYGLGSNAVRCVFMNTGTLRGFTLTGGATAADNTQGANDRGGGLYSSSSTAPLVYDCIVSNNVSLRGGGAYKGAFNRTLFTGNYASNNSSALRESRAYDCLIVTNTGASVIGYVSDVEGIVNCTIVRNGGVALDNSKAYNCIVTENGSVANSAHVVMNCCVSAAPNVGTNNIVTTDARFVDSANGDFRLLANSLCLNAANTNFVGSAGAAANRTDYLGNARLQGSGLDMGAVEGAATGLAAVSGEKQGTGSGTLAPTTRALYTTLPTQIVFTATAGTGSALRHFTVNGAKMPDCGNTFTLTVTQPGSYTVAAVFYPARYVDAVNGSDANDGASSATAWRTLQFAATNATDGMLVLAAPGVYGEGLAYAGSHSNRVAITRNIVLKGSSGASQTFISGARAVGGNAYGCGTNAVRCAYLSSGALEGFTLTGGASSVSDSDADGDRVRGGALYATATSLEVWDCVISNNVASRGGAAWGGALHRCLIANNQASNNGIVRFGDVYDSLFVGNTANWVMLFGAARAFNCTATGNTGGGFGELTVVYNSIAYGNTGSQANSGAVCTNCCIGGALFPGAGNLSADPLFVDAANGDYRLRADSPCVNAGNSAFLQNADGTDLAGAARVQGGGVNMGAYETTVGTVTATATSGGTISPAGTFFLTNDVTFVATPWEGRVFRYFETNGVALSGSDTSLTLYAAENAGTAVILRAVFQDGFYVDAENGSDANSGLETNLPLRTLQAAAVLARAGDTVRVAPGFYAEGGAVSPDGALTNRLVVTNAITLVSLQGAEKTFIVGARSSQNAHGCGSDAVRCVYLSAGTLQGFTLTGGATDIANGPTGEDYGGGLHAATDGTVIDCVISNNVAYTKGGGVSMATLHRCLIANNALVNTSAGFGSGVRGSTVYDSLVVDNRGVSCIAFATLINVTAYNNTPVQTSDVFNSVLYNTSGGNSYVSTETGRKVYASCLTGSLGTSNNGGGNLFTDPLFVAPAARDFRLHALSPCINSGNSSYGAGRLGLDYAQATRIQGSQIDMGAYEGGVAGMRVHSSVYGGGTITPAGVFLYTPPASQTFSASPWAGRTFLSFSTNGVAIPNTGTSITLTGSATVSYTLVARFSGTVYADAAQVDDSGDGLSWATAKRTLQAAVDLAAEGETVLAAPGVYAEGTRVTPSEKAAVTYLLNRVVVTNAIALCSRDGAATTVIQGAFDTGSGDLYGRGSNAVRCVYLGSGTLQGFTLTRGATGSENIENENNRGGGVYVPETTYTPTVLDCIITNNASVRGGGAHAGTLKRCVLRDNYAYNNSSATRGSYAYHCLLANNRTGGNTGGSAAGWAWLFNCTVTSNEGHSGDNASFYNCILTDPSVSCRLYDCCITGSDVTVSTNVNSFASTPVYADADYRLAAGSPGIDRANLASVDNRFGTDLDGAQRMQNARVDLGAYEWDWRPAFSAALDGTGVAVTNVSPFATYATNAVHEAGNAVYLDGYAARTNAQTTVALALRWTIPHGKTVTFDYHVTGTGTLSIYEDATVIASATASDGSQNMKYHVVQNPSALRFVYTPGTGDTGGAFLDNFDSTGGLLLMLR